MANKVTSVANKLVAITENLPAYCDAVSNALATIEGEHIMLNDIASAERDLRVKVIADDPSAVTVMRHGKNWLDLGGENAGDWWNNGREFKRGTYVVGIARTLAKSGGITDDMYAFDGGTLRVKSNVGYYGIGFPRKLLPNTQYTFSAQVNDPSVITVAYALCDNDGNCTKHEGSWHDNKITFTTNETGNVMLLLAPTEANTEVTFSNIQLELGSAVSEFEPFKVDTYTPSADGTVEGVTSLYPVTVLKVDDAVMRASYFPTEQEATAQRHKRIMDEFAALQNKGG